MGECPPIKQKALGRCHIFDEKPLYSESPSIQQKVLIWHPSIWQDYISSITYLIFWCVTVHICIKILIFQVLDK